MKNILLILSLLLVGCTTASRDAQLAAVAKNWCMTIRASEVIPVYPLTEDLQPGDVLLSNTPINEQQTAYEGNGFLPLSYHLTRLQPDYKDFYLGGYGTGGGIIPPQQWQADGYKDAPRAAFPTYSFSVTSGAGLSLAVPVQGIPIGLSLLGTGNATGTIDLNDSYTFGIDNNSIYNQVIVWANQNKTYLAGLSNSGKNYLRVITRVYLVGAVNVSLTNDEIFGGFLSGGSPKPVNLTGPVTNDPTTNYSNLINTLNNVLGDLPGGTVKVTAVSSRSISMNETFSNPLVIGYLGFDLPIANDGSVGTPIPTLQHITK